MAQNTPKRKTLRLDNMPKKIRDIIITEQAKRKMGCDCIISQESTTYKIIEEWDQMKSQNPKTA